MAAVVLSALGAVVAAFGVFGSVVNMLTADSIGVGVFDFPEWYTGYLVVSGLVQLVTTVLLGGGAFLLLRRQVLGRLLVTGGCAVVVVFTVVGFLVVTPMLTADMAVLGDVAGSISAVSLLALVFPVATVALCWVAPTTRWLEQAGVAGRL